MNFINKSVLLILSIFSLSVMSCTKDDVGIIGNGNIKFEFENVANGNRLVFGDKYLNANGDEMSFTQFDYYVSNFSLIKSDGSEYIIPKDSCYFLIHSGLGENPEFEIKNIPAGDYKEFRFIIGIDSAKNVAPISERTGVLDPAAEGAGMYWSWNSGYIFVKTEGTSPQAPLDSVSSTNKFRYHIGLFGGLNSATINNIKQVKLNNGDIAKVRTNLSPLVHLKADVMQLFKSPTVVSVAEHPTVMVTPYSAVIADNYKEMFQIAHIHN
ncbi:MAG TPA: hypothetical protein PK076_12775 [Saprospiraceae bacterium]|nr:hypothetical protein [Saprospiraceae bacterium]HQW57000.1 hypothetical protein [Saprospiraceae bacterium]